MTRVVRFHRHGGPEVLCIETVDVPAPAEGEVQIRVKALGLNRAEALLRRAPISRHRHCRPGLASRQQVSSRPSAKAWRFAPGERQRRAAAVDGALAGLWRACDVSGRTRREASAIAWLRSGGRGCLDAVSTAYGALIDIAGLRRETRRHHGGIEQRRACGASRSPTRWARPDRADADLGARSRPCSTPARPTSSPWPRKNLEARLADRRPQGVRVVFDAVGGPNSSR